MTYPNTGNSNVTPNPAIHSIPASAKGPNPGLKIAKQLEASAQFILEGFIGQVLVAFGGIEIAGVKPFAALAAIGQALIQKANDAYTNANAAQATANTANTTANTAQGNWLSLFSGIPGVSTVTGLLGFLQPSSSGSGIFGTLLNTLFSGTTGTTGVTGKSFDDVLGVLQTQTGTIGGIGTNANSALAGLGTVQSTLTHLAPNVATALEQAIANTLALGQRTNKPVSAGTNPTSETSFTLGHFSSGGSVTTSTLAAGSAIGQVIRPAELATKGFLEFEVSGTSVTNIFANLYKIDPSTNARTVLWNSSNIASTIPTSLNFVRALIPGGVVVNPGDVLVGELVNNGSNSLTIATKATGHPNNANEVIANVGWSRSTSAGGASPSSLTTGQGSYNSLVPYLNIGISTVPADYHPPESTPYSPHGSYSYTLPAWLSAGDFVDLVGVGGGGAGQGEQGYNLGQGGKAGSWNAQRLVVGTDIAAGGTIAVTVGRGGPQQITYFANGVAGTATTFTWTKPGFGTQTLTCAGGAGGQGIGVTYGGGSPGPETWQGQTYLGGASVGSGSTGSAPGGGGGGAPPYLFGGAGADGEAWVVATQS